MSPAALGHAHAVLSDGCSNGACSVLLCRYSVAIMVDTEGSEVHTNELEQPIKAEVLV